MHRVSHTTQLESIKGSKFLEWQSEDSMLNAILAQIQNGYLVSVNPVDLPEGTKLSVHAEPIETSESPEEIERWLAEFDQIPPLQFSAEEEAAWNADRAARKAADIASFFERAESLKRLVE
jgi:hypothetical protein